jgi:uncharacterized membrane protein YgcG
VSTDVREPATDEVARPTTTARTHARRGLVLIAIALYEVWLVGTRTWNLFTGGEEHSVGFIVVHLALYVGSFALAAVLTTIGVRMRREARGTSAS